MNWLCFERLETLLEESPPDGLADKRTAAE
jgi:hypothetical protein